MNDETFTPVPFDTVVFGNVETEDNVCWRVFYEHAETLAEARRLGWEGAQYGTWANLDGKTVTCWIRLTSTPEE